MNTHTDPAEAGTTTDAGRDGLTGEVFGVVAERMMERSDMIALFCESTESFDEWCAWEAYAACRA